MPQYSTVSMPPFDFQGDLRWYLDHYEELKKQYAGNWILVRDKRIWFSHPNKDIVRTKAIELFGKPHYFLFGIEVPDRNTKLDDMGGEGTPIERRA